MNDNDGSRHVTGFMEALHSLVDEYCERYDLRLAEAVGCLELVQQELIQYAKEEEAESGPDDSELG